MMSSSESCKVHHYEEPSNIIRKTSITHFMEKYAKPLPLAPNVGKSNSNANNANEASNGSKTLPNSRAQSKLRSSKSLSALNSSRKERESRASGNVLDDAEVSQVEHFFRAHKTFVYVCRCMANLYFTKTDIVNGGRTSSPRSNEWELTRTGVPVIVFDKGETRSRNKRQLQICLAERGTGFTLWKDVIDNLTDYKSLHPCFHALYLSCDHRQMAGLSFDDADEADMFLRNIEAITSDPLNIALSVPKKNGAKKDKNKRANGLKNGGSDGDGNVAYRRPRKCDISTPCVFQHVTSVNLSDFGRLHSISTLVPNPFIASTRDQLLIRRSSIDLSMNSGQTANVSPVASTASTTSSITSSENSSHCSA